VLVGNVHSIQTNLHGGIDITARAIADHPALRFYDFVFIDEAGISDGVFLGHDLDCFKKTLQARALHLAIAPLARPREKIKRCRSGLQVF